MTHKRQKQIETIALTVLQSANAYTRPVDLNQLLNHLNVELVDYDFGDDVTSCLIHKTGKAVIGVSSLDRYQPRRRQIIAHAMGHFVLGHRAIMSPSTDTIFIDFVKDYYTMFQFVPQHELSTSKWEQEREANAFAASLLLPEPLLLSGIHTIAIDFDVRHERTDLINDIAKLFDVTPELVGFRLANLKTLW